jgi:hypothetical protein
MAIPEHDPPAPGLTEHEAIDDHQMKVGKITDVIYDDSPESRPRWATVKMHTIGREHIAPLSGAYMSEDGRVVLPCDRTKVKHAPVAPHDHVVSRELEIDLTDYYGLDA